MNIPAFLAAFAIGIWSSFWSRLEGAGEGSTVWPDRPAQIGAALFALPVAVAGVTTFIGDALHHLVGYPLGFILMWACAWGWMQTGHADAPKMDNATDLAGGRKELLSPLIDALCAKFGFPIGGAAYCWLFMGVKGFLIHIPLGLYSPVAGLLWPFSYWLGKKIPYDGADEIIAGLSSGVLCFMVLM